MTISEMKDLFVELEQYLSEFDHCIGYAPTRQHFRTYINGQLSDLDRKSVEPIALDADVPPRTLQQLLGLYKWSDDEMISTLQQRVETRQGGPDAIAVIDETSFPKRGEETVGTKRQYCGALGKTARCVVTINLGHVTDAHRSLVSTDLYIPRDWLEDEDRREKVHLPDDIEFRTQWQIGADLLAEAIAGGMRFRYVTADERYGRPRGFRAAVADLGLTYVLEVPCNLVGRRSENPTAEESRVDEVFSDNGHGWQAYHIKDTEKGPVVWEVRDTPFFVTAEGGSTEEIRMIALRNPLSGEKKYFFTNADSDEPIETLLKVAFRRPEIEYLFQRAKGDVGMDHFEVRKYQSVLRHLRLSMVSLQYLLEQTDRLRKKKELDVEPVSDQESRGNAA